jgi:hypothetical protein
MSYSNENVFKLVNFEVGVVVTYRTLASLRIALYEDLPSSYLLGRILVIDLSEDEPSFLSVVHSGGDILFERLEPAGKKFLGASSFFVWNNRVKKDEFDVIEALKKSAIKDWPEQVFKFVFDYNHQLVNFLILKPVLMNRSVCLL